MRPQLHSATALKLHAFGVAQLHDPNWTGCDLFDELKQYTRGRREPRMLLRKPIVNGLAYHLGCWFFRDYLLDESRFADTVDEYSLWFLEDLSQLLRFHHVGPVEEIENLESELARLNALFERAEDRFYSLLESKAGRQKIAGLHSRALDRFGAKIAECEKDYATDYAERVLHDRQLCAHIAQVLVVIGFNGDDDDTGRPRQWCKRPRIAPWVQQMLLSRDRGTCSVCAASIAQELAARPHIDHIVPLAQGGCNDLVNLQLLCEGCNLKKSSARWDVPSSVPPYLANARARSRSQE
jgi:hypothetical protein